MSLTSDPHASFLVAPQEICGVFFQWNNFVGITVNQYCFTCIHACHRDSSCEELLVHPFLGLVGKTRQRRRVENPRLWIHLLWLARKQNKRGTASDHKVFSRQTESY